MKTTVDVSDQLLMRAKRYALEEGTTLRALIEAGLRAVLSETKVAEARPTYKFPVINDALNSGAIDSAELNDLIDAMRAEATGGLKP